LPYQNNCSSWYDDVEITLRYYIFGLKNEFDPGTWYLAISFSCRQIAALECQWYRGAFSNESGHCLFVSASNKFASVKAELLAVALGYSQGVN